VAGRVLRLLQTSEATVAVGTPLLEIGDTRRLEIVAELLTTDALRTRPGDRVRIDRWGGPATLEGRVRRVEPAAFTKVSALGVEEQRVNVLIDITSPREAWSALGDGFRVGLRIVLLSVPDALQVPVSAVFPLPRPRDGPAPDPSMAVFGIVDGRARRLPVEVGGRNGSEAWIRAGLAEGDAVIVYPPATVADGARVEARRP
jgi:HlyD family secretion protein